MHIHTLEYTTVLHCPPVSFGRKSATKIANTTRSRILLISCKGCGRNNAEYHSVIDTLAIVNFVGFFHVLYRRLFTWDFFSLKKKKQFACKWISNFNFNFAYFITNIFTFNMEYFILIKSNIKRSSRGLNFACCIVVHTWNDISVCSRKCIQWTC